MARCRLVLPSRPGAVHRWRVATLTPLSSPFVLLDDARAGGQARLYQQPVRTLAAWTPEAVRDALEEARGSRLHAAGFLAYEAGPAFDDGAPLSTARPDVPLLWLGLFDGWEAVADVPALLPDPAGAWVGAAVPSITRDIYRARFAEVAELIAAGDLYQANLSFRAAVPFAGHPLAVYAALRARSVAGWGAVVDTSEAVILSLSPEQFFTLEGDRLRCRPMKGTALRGGTPADDAAAVRTLREDAKQRAENLMIVDLMRNDLSRVAVPGSVTVPELFAVETYPTVHQMVSSVTATLRPGQHAVDVLAALFPCGSITGAPKLRAMTALAAIEGDARGLYTGAIGRIDPQGNAAFNVAIRTLSIVNERATLGLGSGIVADSRVEEEWAECLAKGAFLTAGQRPIDLIETMAFDPRTGMPLLERHLARMAASAAALGFRFNRHGARNELQAATFRLRDARRVRLLLARSGAMAAEVGAMPAPPARPLSVAVVPLPVAAHDFRLRHKTSDRGFYDAARTGAGVAEVVFVDPDGWLTEGSYTSIFVLRGETLVTPPLARGLLPGVLRAELIAEGRAVEGDLMSDDLAGGFFVGNALRGLMPAIVAVAKGTSATV